MGEKKRRRRLLRAVAEERCDRGEPRLPQSFFLFYLKNNIYILLFYLY